MTREEEIRNKAINEQKTLMESMDYRAGFISGSKWADQTMIDKACAWLEQHQEIYDLVDAWCGDYMSFKNFIIDFRKAMEE